MISKILQYVQSVIFLFTLLASIIERPGDGEAKKQEWVQKVDVILDQLQADGTLPDWLVRVVKGAAPGILELLVYVLNVTGFFQHSTPASNAQ